MHTPSASSHSGQTGSTVPPTKPPPPGPSPPSHGVARLLRSSQRGAGGSVDVRRQPGWPPSGQGAPPPPAARLFGSCVRLAVLSTSGHFVSDQSFAFVDLAGFTALTDVHGDAAAARLAERFCELARQSLRPQVLLVKSIGDAVMLASPDPLGSLLTVEDLLSACLREPDFPVARAGVHTGGAVELVRLSHPAARRRRVRDRPPVVRPGRWRPLRAPALRAPPGRSPVAPFLMTASG